MFAGTDADSATNYWKKRYKSKPGRPPIGMDVIMLIKRMSRDSATWSARRISDELALLGHKVGETTVPKYMVRSRGSDREQAWTTFLHNHMAVTAACDFFVVPTFQLLYCFVVLSHDRRRTLHVNVTAHLLNEYVRYYNESRAHQSLDGGAPVPRKTKAVGQITAKPVLGGLHHVYSRAA